MSAETNPAAAMALPVTIHAQYIKDFSFENPHSPQSLLPKKEQPKMDVD